MAAPVLNAGVAELADLPKQEILASWLVARIGYGVVGDYIDPFSDQQLYAKIAVAYGSAREEADYDTLAETYVWGDLYNAISGESGFHNWSELQALAHIYAAMSGNGVGEVIDLSLQVILALCVTLESGGGEPGLMLFDDGVDTGNLLYDDGGDTGDLELLYA